ncbi:MAG: hypothetical protein KGY74_08765 [Candidatus Cloacimonetes bacterium]|nr:hypothetical protein [Candidatus Cloacimonadota bacterium]
MIEKKIIRFDKGMNEYEVYKDLDSPDKIVNYENIKGGELQIRKSASIWNTGLSSSASALNPLKNIFVWFPNTMPASASGDYCVFVYGINTLRMFYQNASNNWLHTDIDAVTYQASSELRFFEGSDRLLIADGNNPAHFVKINKDGKTLSGELGIPAPTTPIKVDAMTDWDKNIFEENSESDSMANCGLFQYTYTVETKGGNESNPAPLSKTVPLQWFKKTANASDLRWIDRINIKNLCVPEGINDDLLEELDYFNIYRREVKYSAAADSCNLLKVDQVKINAKYDENGNAISNTYTDANPISMTTTVSYNNDPAPIAKDICEVGGHIVLANVQTKINFPFDFQYYCPINIQNKDPKNYIDAIFKLRIFDKSSASSASISNFELDDFRSASVIGSDSLNKLRLYDTDSWTPLSVVYDRSNGDYVDLFVKIPELLPNSVHKIYFAWTNSAVTASGVNDADYQNASGGEWVDIDDDNDQLVFDTIRVQNENTLICSPTNEQGWDVYSDVLPNIADTNESASLMGAAVWYVPDKYLKALALVGDRDISCVGNPKAIRIPGDDDYVKYNFGHQDMVNKFVTYFWFENEELSASRVGVKYIDSHLGGTNHIYLYLDPIRAVAGASTEIVIEVENSAGASEYRTGVYFENTANKYNMLGFSIDFTNQKASAFVKDLSNASSNTNEIDINIDKPEISASALVKVGNDPSYFAEYLAMIYMEKDNYISELNKWEHLSNCMPTYDEIIGYDYSDSVYNKLISFDDVKTIEYEKHSNYCTYSKVNSVGFPSTYFKDVVGTIRRSIPAPSFLPFEYKNTVLLFTRNQIFRFVMKGNAENWADAVDVLIPEIQRVGLLASNSLTRTQSCILWLSEIGVVKWSPKGLEVISENVIDVTTDSYE